MHDMLHTVDEHRRVHAFDAKDPLYPQYIVAVPVEQQAQPDAESGPVQRPIEDQTEAGNRFGMTAQLHCLLAASFRQTPPVGDSPVAHRVRWLISGHGIE